MSRGAPKAPITYEGAHDPARTYLPRQVATKGGTAYLSLATSTGVDPGTDPTVWLPLGGGGGAAVPSGTSLSLVNGVIIDDASAGYTSEVDWTGCTITEGEDYWGVTGSALPLGMVEDSGTLYYPAGEGIYDLQLTMNVASKTTSTDDVGKMVGIGFKVYGSNSDQFGYAWGGYQPMRWNSGITNAIANLAFTWTDMTFTDNGATNARVRAYVDARNLSIDLGCDGVSLLVIKRA